MTCPRRSRRPLALWVAALLLALPLAAADAFAPAGTGGMETVDHALRALQQHRRLLVVGAHPDDEDTVLLTLLSRGWGAEAAYLSLTRGDGGQNLVGEELGEALGVLRTEELLAAREIDGARQYFTRAYDFGYTRSLEETFDLWPREILLEDVVRVVRAFRPQVVVSVFSPTSREGHGQHQAAGVLALEAFHAAGDPSVFPEQRDEGLEPWSPSLLYRAAWWDPEAATLELPADGLDPFRGRSFAQIAMESRSRHASQSMGRSQDPGPRAVRLVRLEGPEGAPDDELFGGVATDLEALADLAPPGHVQDGLRSALEEIRTRAREARARATVEDPAAVAEPLAASLLEIRDLRRRLREAGASDRDSRHLDAFLAEKERIASDGLAAAAGIVFDAWTDRSEAVPGDTIAVQLTLWNAGPFAIRLPGSPLAVTSPAGWLATPRSLSLDAAAGGEEDEEAVARPALETLPPGTLGASRRELAIEPEAPPTVPYFLRSPRSGALYALQPGDRAWWGLPFAPESLQASVRLTLGIGERSVPLTLERPVVARYVDLATGEVREPVRLVPRIEVSVTPEVLLWPLPGEETRSIEVRLRLHGDAPRKGRVTGGAPRGWPAPEPVPFELKRGSPETRVALEIRLPESMTAPRGRFELPVTVATDAGEELTRAVPLVSHSGVRPRPVPEPAETRLSVFPLALPPLDAVGYVPGAADEVSEALAALGVPVEILDPAALAGEDLSRFDAVVVGSRAYEVAPALEAAAEQLDAYVRGGGLLIVQFQRWEYFRDGLPPVSLAMENRGQRTTDEGSPVALLEPGHRVFHRPNRIEDEDWTGWVQERGVYYPTSWGPEVVPLLSLSDPDDPDQRGSLLVARVGEGTYVYTGLAFFRQLPAGVPGAFRLFANLLALSSEDSP